LFDPTTGKSVQFFKRADFQFTSQFTIVLELFASLTQTFTTQIYPPVSIVSLPIGKCEKESVGRKFEVKMSVIEHPTIKGNQSERIWI
jgi:hypothetical protein